MTSKSGKNKKKIGTRSAAECVSCRQCGRVSWDARLECGGPGFNPPATHLIFFLVARLCPRVPVHKGRKH